MVVDRKGGGCRVSRARNMPDEVHFVKTVLLAREVQRDMLCIAGRVHLAFRVSILIARRSIVCFLYELARPVFDIDSQALKALSSDEEDGVFIRSTDRRTCRNIRG